MTTIDLLVQTFEIEFSMTRRILERVPDHLADWTPHPKSMPMGKLARHVADLPAIITLCLTTEGFDIAAPPPPDAANTDPKSVLTTFDEAATKARATLAAAQDADLFQPWTMSVGDRVLGTNPRGITLLHTCLGHLAHHRAQLGMYLRLNNLPVPPVYGPTADEPSPAQLPQS